jgi:hypothetical protein
LHEASDISAKRTQQLISDAVSTTDESPLDIGARSAKLRKPRHPPVPPSTAPGVDFSSKSVLLFPGQGFQFVGMGKKVLGRAGQTSLLFSTVPKAFLIREDFQD